MNPLDKSALLARAAHRASLRPDFLGWVFSRFEETERQSEQKLAESLGVSARDFQSLRLCLRPRSESFALDVEQIARKWGIEAGRLAGMIRHVESLQGMADDRAADAVSDSGLLMAARARRKGPKPPTKRNKDDFRSE